MTHLFRQRNKEARSEDDRSSGRLKALIVATALAAWAEAVPADPLTLQQTFNDPTVVFGGDRFGFSVALGGN